MPSPGTLIFPPESHMNIRYDHKGESPAPAFESVCLEHPESGRGGFPDTLTSEEEGV